MNQEEKLQIQERIVDVLKTVYDPEIPVDIWNLGMIYKIEVNDDGTVDLDMTFTAPNCPAADFIVEDVRTKLESVEGSGNFLMDTMTMMFIPATVGIVECIGEVRAVLVPFLIIIGISTLLVMAVTGCMAQWVMGRKHSGEEQ